MKSLVEKIGKQQAQEVLENAPSGFNYYVHELSPYTGIVGFYADAFIVGIHNPNTHYTIDSIRAELS